MTVPRFPPLPPRHPMGSQDPIGTARAILVGLLKTARSPAERADLRAVLNLLAVLALLAVPD